MKTRPSSTIRFEATTTIEPPVDEVFARLTDLSGYGGGMPRTGLFGTCRRTSENTLAQAESLGYATEAGRNATRARRSSRVFSNQP